MTNFERFSANSISDSGVNGGSRGQCADRVGLTCVFCDNKQLISSMRPALLRCKASQQTVVLFISDNASGYANLSSAELPFLTIRYADNQFNEIAALIRSLSQCHDESDATVDRNCVRAILELPAIGRFIYVSGADYELLESELRRKLAALSESGEAIAAFVHFESPDLTTQFIKSVMLQVRAVCSANATIVQTFCASRDAYVHIIVLLIYLQFASA